MDEWVEGGRVGVNTLSGFNDLSSAAATSSSCTCDMHSLHSLTAICTSEYVTAAVHCSDEYNQKHFFACTPQSSPLYWQLLFLGAPLSMRASHSLT